MRFADGRYELVRSLGRGGMGEVHLAVARGAAGFEKLVAIKLLDARFGGAADVTRSLLREAFLGVRLDHEHIVPVLDLGEDQGRFFVVMEYVRGYTLDHLLAHLAATGRPVPVGAALHVIRAVLDALAYLHALRGADDRPLGLIHGDVSPSNLLLAADGRIKLTDFGLATVDSELADATTIAGKLPYLPPEAFAGARGAQAWDVYAAAAVLYELLAGARAIPGATLAEVRAALRAGPAPLAARRPDLPAPLAEVVERGLTFHAERRLTTVGALRAALDAAAPRQVGDVDAHRALIAEVYGDAAFLDAHGELPSGAAFSVEQERAAVVESTQIAPKTMGRVRPRPLRFGITNALGATKAREHAGLLADTLTERLGREVRPMVLASYAMLVDCLVHGELDLAWTPPSAFVAASDHGAGLVAKLARGGRTTYESALFTRADGDVHALADLRGRIVAWVDRDSASGYLFGAAELRRVLGDLDRALDDQLYLDSHRAVCAAVARGWAAAGATYVSREPGGAVRSSGWSESLAEPVAMRTLWISPPIPSDVIAHRPFLPPELVAEVGAALTALATTDAGRAIVATVFNADGFVAADAHDYDRVRASLRAV